MAFLNDMTVTTLVNAIPQKWETKIRLDAARKSFWGKFVGREGSRQPIIEKSDFTTEPGNQINIQISSPLGQEGQTGDSTLEGNEETLSLGQITITPNVLRHAVAFNWRAKKQANFDLIMWCNDVLSSWMARRTDEDLFNQIINTTPPSVLYAGAATSRATLGPSTTFGINEIMRGKAALQRQGALPIKTIVDGKQEIDWYGVVVSEIDAYNLKVDPNWGVIQRDAGLRGDDNRIFSAALGQIGGVYVYEYTGVRFLGKFGSFLRPEAQVSTAMLAGDTSVTVGTNSNINYTKFIPSTGTLLIDSEQISYTGKTNTTITGLTRGADGTTAAAHAANALITVNNLGRALFFGAEIAARVWGQYPTRITNTRDYGYEQGLGIQGYYGQTTIQDSQSKVPNMILMETYSGNPNTAI